MTSPGTTEWLGNSRPKHLPKQSLGEGLHGPDPRWSGEQHCRCWVEMRLRTIHPNPGPERRRRGRHGGRTAERRKERRDRRYNKRREKRERTAAAKENQTEILEIVTWNLQGVSLRERNRARLKRAIKYTEKKGWEMVLISELRAEQEGVLWFGEGSRQVALIHSRRTGVILRGKALRRWIEDKERRRHTERTTSVIIGNMRLVAVYQPVWSNGREAVEQYRTEVESQIASSPANEVLVVGGDHNAHVGSGSERHRVCGRYGIGNTNQAGEDLLNWCEENDLAHVNSFHQHGNRGTWYNRSWRRWYELDGFMVKQQQRHSLVVKVDTVKEMSLSDHRPKRMNIRMKKRRWRHAGDTRRRHLN